MVIVGLDNSKNSTQNTEESLIQCQEDGAANSEALAIVVTTINNANQSVPTDWLAL